MQLNTHLRELINALGGENRLEVLRLLESEMMSIPQIRRELAKMGKKKPYITVNRYLDVLQELGLVENFGDGRYYLTIKGICTLDTITELENKLEALEKLESLKKYSLSRLPQALRHDITLLENSDYISDPFTLCSEMEKSIILAENTLHLICSDYSKSLLDTMITKMAGGTVSEVKIIKDKWNLSSAIEHIRGAVEKMEMEGESRSRLMVRIYPEIMPVCLLICDRRKVFMSFQPMNEQKPSFQSGYVSDEKEVIEYGLRIFEHYWDRLACLRIFRKKREG